MLVLMLPTLVKCLSGTSSWPPETPQSRWDRADGPSTPAQNFLLILDTGSSDMWVADQDCTTNTCSSLSRFNTAESSTYDASNTPFQISYGSGDAAGLIVQDTVTMGGFTVQNQGFGQYKSLVRSWVNVLISDSHCESDYLWIGLEPDLGFDGSSMGEYRSNGGHTILGGISAVWNVDESGDGSLHGTISW